MAGQFIQQTQGAQLSHIVPRPNKLAFDDNYLSIADNDFNFAKQFLPEVYEKEVERYGNRTISGFLRMVGAEMPMASDEVVWSEQGRLHIAYDSVSSAANGTTITLTGLPTGTDPSSLIGVGQTLVISNGTVTAKARVDSMGTYTSAASNASTQVVNIKVYGETGSALPTALRGATTSLNIFVFGSEYAKGGKIDTGAVGANTGTQYVSVEPSFQQYANSLIILKSQYVVSGSDMAQIGWVEVATEDGASGYLWYLKAESETRLRFEDYLEMAMVEGELNAGAAGVPAANPGTEGLFAAIQNGGNVEVGFTAAAGLDAFDDILKNLDTQGAIEENMLFLNRSTALDFDDMLASISGGFAGGVAFGLFENSEEMALNLGFSGFRRGSYDFYKTDWKYLNDASTRGAMTGPASIEGVLVPAGTSTVYDQILGTNIRRPFLHVRYRASQADDRRMKSWLTGSVGGAFTSSLDAMEVNFLSERCLVTQARNNFVLFKGI